MSATVHGRRESKARMSARAATRSPPAEVVSAITSAWGVNRPANSCREPSATGATNDSAGGRTAVFNWIRSGEMRAASSASRSTSATIPVTPASIMTSSHSCPR